ncbi:polyprenyl synthetase family protein [Pseudomarimonas salicorniae]|uniref:Polyprenyl synthetase family protein n=1 Tax=Pseudomarimonas salicorniae TaxID=2933270 RepID=A0ABT0GHQ5_9GAMM|nr:farnesyl diphosphate synthase [Lysobacter sp. CAU 1642]MCK7594076.1 polyprenyl synthetase family protein [Lysobacter sp. CAU 1642]
MSAESGARLRALSERAEARLDAVLPAADDTPERLHQAMRHAVLGGGKRLRPLLVYAAGSALGAELDRLDAGACAVELIHAYSLVHDDLPAMDDDDLRRGRPTVHVAFDEATAILAGDALQSLAYSVLAGAPLPAEVRVSMLACLAESAGAPGMCGGQAIDVEAVGRELDLAALKAMHARKTGALIRAAVRLGALAAGAGPQRLGHLDHYASALGLAFQIKDDLLDVESDSATLGKTAGKDAAANKPTYVAALGLDGARRALDAELQSLHRALSRLDCDTSLLATLGEMAAQRSH